MTEIGSKQEIERMIQEAEKFKADNEEYRKRVKLKHNLEDYVYRLSNALKDEEFCSMLSNKKKVQDAIEDAEHFLDGNQLAQVDEYKYNLKELLLVICKQVKLEMIDDSADTGDRHDNKWWQKKFISVLGKDMLCFVRNLSSFM